jgi:hypothetical protein
MYATMTRHVPLCFNMFYADCTKSRRSTGKCCQEIISDYLLLSVKHTPKKDSEDNCKY